MSGFHDYIAEHLFKGSLPQWQREPVDKLVAEGLRRNRSLEDTAYVLATAFWETGRFRHSDEIGEGQDHDYGEPIWLIRGVRVAYFGRGHTQLTWLRNYAKMSIFLSLEFGREIDLVNKPDLATEPEMSAQIIWEGMIRGMFTGKNLADYITPEKVDYVEARRIVNGTDRAGEIAEIARRFESGLRLIDGKEGEKSACGLSRSDCPIHQRSAA
jgi:hypothetical protein